MEQMDYYKIAFASLKMDGSNADEFFKRRYDKFRLWNSELSNEDKIQAVLSGQLNGQTEIEIEKDLSVKTFIETEMLDFREILKTRIEPELREKINLWVAYLEKRARQTGMENQAPPTLEKYIVLDPEKISEFTEKLKERYAGKRGRDIALMIVALESMGRLKPCKNKELYRAIQNTFNADIGTDSGINDFRNKHNQKNGFEYDEVSREIGFIESLTP